MRLHASLLALAVALALPGCTDSGTSDRCKTACARDAECYEEVEEAREEAADEAPEGEQREGRSYKFDRDECETTCASLERDEKGKELVRAHATCVAGAQSCREVLACQ